jgi:hypothetical protein
MEEQKQHAERLAETHIFSMLLLTYADLISDIVLASLLLLGKAAQVMYGIVSFCFLGTSLVVQVLLVKYVDRKPWLSKDVFLTAAFFGPALKAYHALHGDQQASGTLLNARAVLALLKGIQMTIETLPAIVLQLMLLNASPKNWTSPELITSLSISITAAAVLMVNTESSVNGVAGIRRRNIEYYGYLPPLMDCRRAVLLASLTFFMAGYLVLAASSIAVALQLFPSWVVATVLVCDCGLHHLRDACRCWRMVDAGR